MKKAKANIHLIFGSIILLLILFVMIFPEMFINKSPYTIQHMRFLHENGKLLVERAPFPPAKDFFLGSDDLGRDILSYIIYGTRLTIFLGVIVAIGQFIIAIPMALYAGFGNRIAKSTIMQFNVIFSAIPALLISIILLRLDFFTGLDKQKSIIAFVLILSAVGWPKLASLLMERVEVINQQPFIKGEVAIGKRRYKIALENVLPHLAPELVVLFFMEIARNLSMIMQLGIFGVFVGNLKIINNPALGVSINTNISVEPEWASMLSTSRNLISMAPWAVIFPALAFFISVLGFNLFGEGLRKVMQKKDSKVIPAFRKLISLDVLYLWRSASKKVKMRNAAVVIILIGVFTLLTLINKEDYSMGVNADTVTLPDQVIIGTQDSTETAKYIADRMAALGIEPMEGENYLMSYDIGQSYMLQDQIFSINTADGPIILEPDCDFAFMKSGNISFTGAVYDATKEDMYNIDNYSRFKDKFVLIDKAYYNDASINSFINDINNHVRIKGMLLIARNDEVIKNLIIDASEEMSVILISREVSEELKNNLESVITVSSSAKALKPTGNNVIGIYKGIDEGIGDEAILIGMNYNYINESGKEVLQFNLELMERLCALYGNKRSIIFMFLDGTISEAQHGVYYISQNFPYSSSKVKVYIDLTGLVEESFDHIEFSSAQAPITRRFAWTLGQHLEREFIKNKFEIEELETRNIDIEYYFTGSQADNVMFWDRGIATIIIENTETELKKHNINEIGSILLETISKNNY